MIAKVSSLTIGDIIQQCVPGEFHDLFLHPADGCRHWWDWSVDSDVGEHVTGLITKTRSYLIDIPDYAADAREVLWTIAAKQSLCWAFG